MLYRLLKMIDDLNYGLWHIHLTRYTTATITKYRYHSDRSTLLSTATTGYDSATPSTLPPQRKYLYYHTTTFGSIPVFLLHPNKRPSWTIYSQAVLCNLCECNLILKPHTATGLPRTAPTALLHRSRVTFSNYRENFDW